MGSKSGKKKAPPEQLVLGARLHCPHGSEDNILWVEPNGLIDINHVPQATVEDCVPLVNILPFGLCNLGGDSGECRVSMKFEGPWENPEPQGILLDGKEAITVKSELVCRKCGFALEIKSSGQDHVFIEWLVYRRELEANYPGLLSILEDPDGSLYLNEGMYEMALKFLEEEMEANQGEIGLYIVDDVTSPMGYYMKSALGHLEPAVNVANVGTISNGMDAVVGRYEESVREEVDVHVLNGAMMSLLKRDCKETDRLIREGGFYRWQEENKEGLRLMAEWMKEAEFSALMAASMMGSLGKAQRREGYTEEVRENLREGKSIAKGAGRTNHSPKIKDAKFKEGGSGAKNTGSGSWEAQTPRTGEEWHKHFNETYGSSNVTWESASIQDIIDMPSRITDFTPQQIANLSRANGWAVEPLGKGGMAGVPFDQGGGFSMHAPNGGSEYIQYHPGGGHHGTDPYYKVSSGPNGTVRYNLNGGKIQ